LDDDAEERQVEYPTAINELDKKKRKQAVDDDSESEISE
jgi:hypothetical protein